jgi:hypothetical protein
VDSAPVTGPVTFIWARQDGRPLPEGSTQANGEMGCTILVLREWRAYLASGGKLRSYQRAAEKIFKRLFTYMKCVIHVQLGNVLK